MRKLLSAVFSLGFMSSVFATPSVQTAFVKAYPAAKNTALDNCSTCHMPVISDSLNRYGYELVFSPMGFKEIENLDSDFDGVNNIDEINALKNPGSRSDDPEYFVFTNRKGRVDFDHESHILGPNYLSNGKCANCHGTGKFTREYNDAVLVKQFAHQICWRCHKLSNSENAPRECSDCHMK
ncbi:MAG: cytochrome c3 family protein [Bdellovibrio sp.]|nr:cytochrome c3 family protein [Bdellovibrio sp.]